MRRAIKRWWVRRRYLRHCPHSELRAIYGDEIHAVGGWRLRCRICGRYLYGPASLAKMREPEATASSAAMILEIRKQRWG